MEGLSLGLLTRPEAGRSVTSVTLVTLGERTEVVVVTKDSAVGEAWTQTTTARSRTDLMDNMMEVKMGVRDVELECKVWYWIAPRKRRKWRHYILPSREIS